MFSVVIPLYNKCGTIRRAITSVLNQTYQDFELIVVNDGSTDGSEQQASAVVDDRLSVINKANGGVSSARNQGIAGSSRPYVAFLDADDIWSPEFLAEMASLINEHPDCTIFASSYHHSVSGKPMKPPHVNVPFKRGKMTNYFQLQRRYFYPLVCSSAVVLQRQALKKTGGFNEKLSNGEDLDLWYRTILSGGLAYINQPLATYLDTYDDIKNRDLDHRNNIVFNLGHFAEYEQNNADVRKYLLKFRLKGLKHFYLNDRSYDEVKKILSKIPTSEYTTIDFVLYKLIPRRIVKQTFAIFQRVKKLGRHENNSSLTQ
jgi:glycosyltransferase involved in cell wall biosynthesis